MTQNSNHLFGTIVLLTSILFALSPRAHAVDLNYESLSSLEEPLAIEVADVTITVNGLLDLASRNSDVALSDTFLRGNFQLNAETQLKNSWTLGASYFAFGSSADTETDDYQDNAAVYLSGIWGTVSAGNVTQLVREATRRKRGAGNAELALDDYLGGLGEEGVAYLTRFGPTRLITAVDDDGNFEVGVSYQRPMGNKDYRFTLRFRDSEVNLGNEVVLSQALGFVSELTYGSTVFDLGLAYEQLEIDQFNADRVFASVGASRKWGVWTGSIEGHIGDTDGQAEKSYALGLSYDFARGVSLNLAINYTDAQLELGELTLINASDTTTTLSARYSF